MVAQHRDGDLVGLPVGAVQERGGGLDRVQLEADREPGRRLGLADVPAVAGRREVAARRHVDARRKTHDGGDDERVIPATVHEEPF
ncbi:hypothetical protein D3C86_1803950 [compost metagenome]